MSFRFPTEKFAPREQLQPFLELWLRKIFLEDWSTKLIALAITLALWFGISGQQTPGSRPLNEVRLNFRLSNEMEITNEPPRLVEVTLTGDKGKLDRLDKRDLVVSADISDRPAGEWLVELKPGDVIMELPTGIKIDEIQPNRFLLKLEKREEREIEIKPEFEGHLPDGMEVYEDETVVTPAKIRVRGPSSFVNSIDSITTEKISLENRKGDFTSKQIAVNLLNPKITVLDTVVDVAVKIGPKRSEKKFTVTTENPWGVKEVFTVTLVGPAQDLAKITGSELRIEFINENEGKATPSARVSDQFTQTLKVKTIHPSTVSNKIL